MTRRFAAEDNIGRGPQVFRAAGEGEGERVAASGVSILSSPYARNTFSVLAL